MKVMFYLIVAVWLFALLCFVMSFGMTVAGVKQTSVLWALPMAGASLLLAAAICRRLAR